MKTSRTCFSKSNYAIAAARMAVLVLAAFALFNNPPAHAQTSATPPERMTYQGYLVDANGAVLAPATPQNFPVVFRIYSVPTGGTALWAESQTVTVDKGNFSVLLGEGALVSGEPKPGLSALFTNATTSDRFVGVTVTIGGNPQVILPRLRLVPNPYSFLASSANKLIQTNNGSTYLSYDTANSRVAINGNAVVSGGITASSITAASFTSTGSGFTGLTAFSTGPVGIGTTTPSYLLSLGSGIANTKLAIGDGGVGSAFGFGIQANQFRFHVNNSADRFSFLNGSAGTEMVTITGNGRVGIGTTTPAVSLDVRTDGNALVRLNSGDGNTKAYSAMDLTDVTGAGWGFGKGPTDNFYIDESGVGNRLTILKGGNTGVGTATPAAKLDVRGDVKLGSSGQYFAPGGEENLRIVRGTIAANGTITSGTGFTVTRVGPGDYQINFTQAFNGLPTVTFTAGIVSASRAIAIFECVANGTLCYQTITPGSPNTPVDRPVMFIAVGPR